MYESSLEQKRGKGKTMPRGARMGRELGSNMATLSTISSMATWWEWGGRGEEARKEGKVSRTKNSGGGATRARLAAAWHMHYSATD